MEELSYEEFEDEGYLLEVNRRFLHPMGLELYIDRNDCDDFEMQELRVKDYRDKAEVCFLGISKSGIKKLNNIKKLWNERMTARIKKLGYMIQPIEQ